MKGKTPAALYLEPILDTYLGAGVALVGCTSRGTERYSCEFDVLVVTNDRHPPTSLKLGEAYADVLFATEKEVLKPANPERALAIAGAKPIRDSALVLSTAAAASTATFSDSAKVACRTRLTSALKSLVRAEEWLNKKSPVDADFWLLAASYEFAYALLLQREGVPSPSHLLSQLREPTKGSPRGFEGVSIGAGLESATRAACGTRLDGLVVLHDLIREGSSSATAESEWSNARVEILSAKARELVTRVELAECYSFLGQEVVDALLAVQRLRPKQSLGSLSTGGDKLLGERLLRQLGLARGEKGVKSALDVVRRQVVLLTRKI